MSNKISKKQIKNTNKKNKSNKKMSNKITKKNKTQQGGDKAGDLSNMNKKTIQDEIISNTDNEKNLRELIEKHNNKGLVYYSDGDRLGTNKLKGKVKSNNPINKKTFNVYQYTKNELQNAIFNDLLDFNIDINLIFHNP